MNHAESLTLTLNPGDVLSVTTDSNATSVVTRMPDVPGGAFPNVKHSLAASTTKRIGPFAGTTWWQIDATNGVVTYSIGKLDMGANITSVVKVIDTNGTTPVNIFDSAGASCGLKVTSIDTIAKDVTAGNIITKNGSQTVATVAKSTTSGAHVGATSLANATFTAGGQGTVESSSAGNATVIISFDVV